MRAPRAVRIASRGSRLAMAQAGRVRQRLSGAWPALEFEIVTIETRGDREIDRPLPEIGGKGLFTEALQDALRDGQVDLAVHSLKDLPTDPADGLKLGAVPEREDARDAWVVRRDGPKRLADAPAGFRVGTGSERRRAQILAERPDLRVASIRGNVETRVSKLDAGRYDGLVLALAGLRRLGIAERVTATFDAPAWLPAPGQGAIGVESRDDDAETDRLLTAIDDAEARSETEAERALLATLQGGCQVPVGARAFAEGGELVLYALVARPDGTKVVRADDRGPRSDPEALGRRVAERILADGGAAILEEFRARVDAAGGP